ncbi:hydroxycarboxylic acid receptor 2-like [Cyprinodon tularosa]|uniref:hydroxycarboxylic acid receptor 2-like n=1 Tax=Cyprinodon tularosa TaxID=77115 RepID=UPI0018E2004B|nr:hydroxycarboxylic acid receptor 2-like [Cyprinodon tularosa]
MLCNVNGTILISVLPPVILTEFAFGFVGNGLALWIFCFHLRPWKSSTVFLFNLAMADFLLNVALPLRASYYFSGLNWKFGLTGCNACLFMLAMNRSGSTFFLMIIAVDRYMHVVHPHHPFNSLSVKKASVGALGIWFITILVDAPIFALQHRNTTYCESFNTDVDPQHGLTWHEFMFLCSFFIPLLVILYCTVHIVVQLRRRQLAQNAKIRKALYFITVVVVIFFICFLPSNITLLIIWIRSKKASSATQVCRASEELAITFYVVITLTYLNSALDPLVYYFSSPVFKNICRKVLRLSPDENTDGAEKKTRETGSQSLSQL